MNDSARDEVKVYQDDQEMIRQCLEDMLHVMERKDFDAPPSVHIKLERNAQRIWKTVGGDDIDAIYPDYMSDSND